METNNISCIRTFLSQYILCCTTCKSVYNILKNQHQLVIKVLLPNCKFYIGGKLSGVYRNDPKFSDRYAWANSADPDQIAPRGAV